MRNALPIGRKSLRRAVFLTLAGLAGVGGGLTGRLIAVAVIGIPAVRIGLRLARWGGEPIVDDR